MASFERAILRAESGETTVTWPCDPYEVLGPLLQGSVLPDVPLAPHHTIVSSALPGLFRVARA